MPKRNRMSGLLFQRRWMSEALHMIEMVFALLLVGIVIVASVVYLSSLAPVAGDFSLSFRQEFEELLGNILLLIVGIELAELMVVRERSKILDVMVFVVARKVLLEKEVVNILVGAGVLAILFGLRLVLLRYGAGAEEPVHEGEE